MKRILYLLFTPLVLFGQIAPSTNFSYIRESVARVATTNETDLDDHTKAINHILYLDGLGRPIQSVGYKTSPNAQDMLMGTNTLDPLGRVKRSYLPVQSNASNGSYQNNATSIAQTFYNDTAPYSEVETYEASPYSRPIKTVGAGQAFRVGTSKGKTEQIYTAGAGIRKYFVNEDANGNVTSVNGSATFSDGDLLMRVVIDEENNSIKEFTDREGRTIERWQISPNGTTLKTAFVFDDVGRLRYIIPPKAYNLANTFDETNTPNSTYFKEGIYAFRYDERGRIVEKYVPSGGWKYQVYNELDQVVMTQDPRQRETNIWVWVKYDGHGRTVMSGTLTNTADRATIQGYFLSFLDDKQFEERSTAGGNLYGYTSRSFPSAITINSNDVKRVYYFDDYDWVSNSALNFIQYKNDRWYNSKGLATGSMIRKLDTGVFLKSVLYYDDKNRLIQTQTENRFGAINQSDIVLNFAGDLLEEHTIYRRPSKATITLKTAYSYDHIGRKTGAVHYLNGKPTPLAKYMYDAIGRLSQKRLMQSGNDIIIENSPQPNGDQDIANRYVLLNAGTITAENGTYLACISPEMLQEIDYRYNVRGQLIGINTDVSGNISLTNGDVFGLKLDYHETGQFFDGKLQQQTWKTSTQATNRGFSYGYDGFKRIQSATYNGVGAENYSLWGMGYDDNGNITNLQRNGLTGANTWGQIDNLTYHYLTTSNKLSYIEENSLTDKGFKDVSGTADYTFYDDGSLKSDNNRGITLIEYNYMGLPDIVHFGSTKRIENVYDAEGLKLSQKLVNGNATITTDYMGDLIYRNDSLKTILHDEGRIAYQNENTYIYQFFIYDHLGNTRAIIQRLNATTALVQENHYGAWGEVLEGIGTQGDWNWLYQSQEFISDYGYDFHARSYDSWSGRFDGIDPVDNYSLGGYVGMMNNPLSYIDPDGREPVTLTIALIGLAKAVAISAGISAASYTASIAFSKGGFDNWSWGQFGKNVGIGAISGAVSFGIGSAFGSVASATQAFDLGKELARASVHGFANGIISEASGGNFGQGFASGAFGSFAGSLTDMIGNPFLQVGASALSGGIGSKISGGNFWQGFATGGIVAGANHLMHPPQYEYNGRIYTSKQDLYLAILGDQAMAHYGIDDMYAALAVLMGSNTISTRGKFAGATQGTSVLSEFLRKEYPQTFSKITKGAIKKLPTLTLGGLKGATTLGAFAGRTIPLIGWGMLAYDAGSILYNTQKIYNGVTINPK